MARPPNDNPIIVIQCAGRKNSSAGRFRDAGGKEVLFVARPDLFAGPNTILAAKPDDAVPGDGTWRQRLSNYNTRKDNPHRLLRAGELYDPPIYGELVRRFGPINVFFLSAGWGLIRGDFLTPDYNITFSRQGEPWTRRSSRDRFEDFNQLEQSAITPSSSIYFFGAPDYLSLYQTLMNLNARKVIYSLASAAPRIRAQCAGGGYEIIAYETARRTNWHYGCAEDFLAERIAM